MTATAAGSSTAVFLSSLQTVPVVHPAHFETDDASLATEILPAPPPLPPPAAASSAQPKRDLKRPAARPPPSYLPASDPGSTFSSVFATVTYAGPDGDASSSRRPKRARMLASAPPRAGAGAGMERANERPQRTTRPPHRYTLTTDAARRPATEAAPRAASPTSPSADDERERSMSFPVAAAADDEGNAADSDLNHMSHLANGAAHPAVDPPKDAVHDELLLHNNDHCSACRSHGSLVYCDGCPRAFHLWCLNPPIEPDDAPREPKWLCPSCQPSPPTKRRSKVESSPLFSPLFDSLRGQLPVEFQLPSDVRGYFRDVATGPRGGYLGGGKVPRLHRHGVIEDRDPYKLRERDSAAVICFRCNKSAYSSSSKRAADGPSKRPRHSADPDSRRWRSIVSCDYCNLHWHLDCLDPPLTVMPPRGHKWMCPNHVDQVLPTRRIPKHIHKTVDIDKPGIMNNGNIDVIPSEDIPPLGPPVDEVFIGGQKYRVPERVVILDFWDRCKRVTPASTPQSRMDQLQNDAIEALAALQAGRGLSHDSQPSTSSTSYAEESMDMDDFSTSPQSASTGSTLSSLTPTPPPEVPRISLKIRIPPLSSLNSSPKRSQTKPRRSLRSSIDQKNGVE